MDLGREQKKKERLSGKRKREGRRGGEAKGKTDREDRGD